MQTDFHDQNDYRVQNDFREQNDQFIIDDEQNTTTETSDDYLTYDTESVDRLALDGETRDPISSSTIDSYNY